MKTKIIIITFLIILIGCVMNQHSARLEAGTIKILTCNVGDLGGHKQLSTSGIAEFLKSCGNVDVMLLQEIRGNREAETIARFLDMDDCLFLASRRNRQGIAILSKYSLSDSDHIYFNKSPRGYGALSACVKLNGEKIRIVSVHLDRYERVTLKNGGVASDLQSALRFLEDEIGEDTVRSRSAQEIIDWLKNKKEKNIIMGGDFNTIPQSKTVSIIKSMFSDALCPSISCFQGTYTRIEAPVPVRIDYIFHTPSLKKADAEIIKRSPGDHYPVVGEFYLTP